MGFCLGLGRAASGRKGQKKDSARKLSPTTSIADAGAALSSGGPDRETKKAKKRTAGEDA